MVNKVILIGRLGADAEVKQREALTGEAAVGAAAQIPLDRYIPSAYFLRHAICDMRHETGDSDVQHAT